MSKLLGTILMAVGIASAAQATVVTPLFHVTPVPSAPEIDPAGAFGALTLLLGGLAVVSGRRLKRNK